MGLVNIDEYKLDIIKFEFIAELIKFKKKDEKIKENKIKKKYWVNILSNK